MNRRSAIKGVLAFSFLGASVFSLTKFFGVSDPIGRSHFLNYKTLIAELAETIIPRTDTPGAKDAKVEDYIITMLVNCTDEQLKRKFLDGLKDVQEVSLDKFDRKYEDCNMPEKVIILKEFEHRSIFEKGLLKKVENKLWGQSFFVELKNLTVRGYFTSKLGATECLAYDYVPGKFEACIPLTTNQNSWATK